MSTIHLHAITTATPEQFLAGKSVLAKAFANTVKAVEARNPKAMTGICSPNNQASRRA